tara:strand:- start:6417 stop:7022 length:606 start_codon:yes stop_codon:yes gene_type:complete
MTANIMLIRHAAHSDLGLVLSGRRTDVPLSPAGVAQARSLASVLRKERLDELQTSPVQRARETAAEIGEGRDLVPAVVDALDEIDFGSWTGRRFDQLEEDPGWREWNERRGDAATPGGEIMAEVQQRVLDHLQLVARGAAGKVVAMVTHCDVIRAAVAGVLGLALHRILQFEVEPAAVSRIEIGEWGARLLSLNEKPGQHG